MYKFSRYCRAVENKVASLSCVFEIAPTCNWINTSRMRNRWFMTWIICSKPFSLWSLEWFFNRFNLLGSVKLKRWVATSKYGIKVKWRPKTNEGMPFSLYQQLPCFVWSKRLFFLYFEKLYVSTMYQRRINTLNLFQELLLILNSWWQMFSHIG